MILKINSKLLGNKVCPKLKQFKLVKILRFESQKGIFGCDLKHDHFENPMHYINSLNGLPKCISPILLKHR